MKWILKPNSSVRQANSIHHAPSATDTPPPGGPCQLLRGASNTLPKPAAARQPPHVEAPYQHPISCMRVTALEGYRLLTTSTHSRAVTPCRLHLEHSCRHNNIPPSPLPTPSPVQLRLNTPLTKPKTPLKHRNSCCPIGCAAVGQQGLPSGGRVGGNSYQPTKQPQMHLAHHFSTRSSTPPPPPKPLPCPVTKPWRLAPKPHRPCCCCSEGRAASGQQGRLLQPSRSFQQTQPQPRMHLEHHPSTRRSTPPPSSPLTHRTCTEAIKRSTHHSQPLPLPAKESAVPQHCWSESRRFPNYCNYNACLM